MSRNEILIQSHSEGKVNILGGDSTGHSEKNVATNICQILNCSRHRFLGNYKHEGIGKGNVVTLLAADFILVFNLFFR